MNLVDISQHFTSEEECLAFLEKKRWPKGVICPTCGSVKISRITRKSKTKNVRKSLFQCLDKACKRQFSVTSGTIYHDSHLPVSKWFMAISIMMTAKKGISSRQLQAHLGISSYQTAWHMTHRIRECMMELNPKAMTGVLEMDETYLGGRAKRRGINKLRPKDMVLGLRERSQGGKTGRVRYLHIPDAKKETIAAIVDHHIDPSAARVITDDAAVYDVSFNPWLKKRHRTVNHSIEWIVPGSKIHTNTIESMFSLLKRGLICNAT